MSENSKVNRFFVCYRGDLNTKGLLKCVLENRKKCIFMFYICIVDTNIPAFF